MTRRHTLSLVFILGMLLFAGGLFLQNALPVQAQDDANPLGEPPTFLAEYYEAWVSSPHANFEDDAFRHWDEDGEISERCATCHSTPGYLDFLGADGTEAGVVNAPAPLGSVVNCNACHNSATEELTAITFPSGATISELGDSSRCMVCHQGRASGLSVVSAVEEAGLADQPHTVSEELGFINIHYYAAAASVYGSEVNGGFEFAGNAYHMRNEHVEGYATCAGCHDPHTLELALDECVVCHEGADSIEGVRAIRSVGSLVDFDGDGDMEEGILGEIETLQSMLYTAIQAYAAEVVGTPIGYSESHPYYFTDTDGNGEISEEEAIRDNAYASFTPALLEAVYNYQVTQKDPGGYAHNPNYHIQLLFDSIAALNEQLGENGVDLSAASRDSFGHFASSSEAFRHWDEDGEVSASCSKCHSAEGLPFFLENGVTIAFEPSNALECTTCHTNFEDFALYPVPVVEFPSGAELGFGEESASNICLTCHQGRESTVSLNSAINRAGVGDDEVSEALSFRNPHYFGAGTTIFGTESKGAYEYEGKEYTGLFQHTRRFDECADCHNVHSSAIIFEECTDCHEEVETVEDVELIRAHPDDKDPVDYNGNGDVEEPIKAEIDTFVTLLYDQILAYSVETVGTPIVFAPGSYPYWFIDTNGDGVADPDEANYGNRYNQWTPELVRAAYNYTYFTVTPGAFAHNPDYTIQVLYDTLEAMDADVSSFIRAEVRE